MDQVQPQNGTIELRFNGDRTLVLANIHPANNGGESVTLGEVHDRLRAMGVTYGACDATIEAAINYTRDRSKSALDVVVAQGVIPVHGINARVHYRLPMEDIARPLPAYAESIPMPDWFGVSRQRFVQA